MFKLTKAKTTLRQLEPWFVPPCGGTMLFYDVWLQPHTLNFVATNNADGWFWLQKQIQNCHIAFGWACRKHNLENVDLKLFFFSFCTASASGDELPFPLNRKSSKLNKTLDIKKGIKKSRVSRNYYTPHFQIPSFSTIITIIACPHSINTTWLKLILSLISPKPTH